MAKMELMELMELVLKPFQEKKIINSYYIVDNNYLFFF